MLPLRNLTFESKIPYITRVATAIGIKVEFERKYFDVWCIECTKDCTTEILDALPERLKNIRNYSNDSDYIFAHVKFAVFCSSCAEHYLQYYDGSISEAYKIYNAIKKIDPSVVQNGTSVFIHYAILHWPAERMVSLKKIIALAHLFDGYNSE